MQPPQSSKLPIDSPIMAPEELWLSATWAVGEIFWENVEEMLWKFGNLFQLYCGFATMGRWGLGKSKVVGVDQLWALFGAPFGAVHGNREWHRQWGAFAFLTKEEKGLWLCGLGNCNLLFRMVVVLAYENFLKFGAWHSWTGVMMASFGSCSKLLMTYNALFPFEEPFLFLHQCTCTCLTLVP
jgi:hypothetical protein